MKYHAASLLGGASLLLATAIWFALAPVRNPAPRNDAPVYTDWNFNPFAKGAPLDAVQHNHDAQRTAEAARDRVQQVWQTGSLRGSDLDGDWGSWRNGQLQPSASLRRRFDYLLTALGEVQPADLRHWVAQEVERERSAAAAQQVLAVWDRYLTLQQTAFTQSVSLGEPSTWAAAMAERSAQRQRILGLDWAQAFYGEEEQAFTQMLQRRLAAGTAPAGRETADDAAASAQALLTPAAGQQGDALQAQRVQQFGAEAAERLRQEDAQWADWERRLGEARTQLQALAARPELSDLQRREAQGAYLAQAFRGGELLRAKALLGMPP